MSLWSETMPKPFSVVLELPAKWRKSRLPPALNRRLHVLLDKQDEQGSLSREERGEAEALAELNESLSLARIVDLARSKGIPA